MRAPSKGLALLALLYAVAPAVAAPPPNATDEAAKPSAPPSKNRAPPRAGKEARHGVVNLNEADAAVLERLPGVGPVKAQRIVEHRRGHPFHRVEDLARVRGFGRKTVARLRPHLAVAGPTTLGDPPPTPPAKRP